MAWQDRDYYGSDSPRGYLSNPASILGFSVPFGVWFGVRVRLHFWLLLVILFVCVGYAQAGSLSWMSIYIGFLLIALLLHELGHRICAQLVGGSHNEFMLWPAGGMIPVSVPAYPWATFVGHVGGVAANLAVAFTCTTVIWLQDHRFILPSLDPLQVFNISAPRFVGGLSPSSTALLLFMNLNMGIFFAALLPYYWFDGASIMESILWPWTGHRRSINVTCWVGMILAVPMFVLSIMTACFLNMVFWALLFASAYNRRKELPAEDYGGYEDALAQSLANQRSPRARVRKPSAIRRWVNERKAADREKLQQQIDDILEKVAREGMHSLSEREKKTLERASRELRDRDTR